MNKKLLKEKIRASGTKAVNKSLTELLGISEKSLCEKTQGKTQFKADEIDKIRREYGLTDAETIEIFIRQEGNENHEE